MQDMNEKKEWDCEHPDKLKGKPGKCSPEQIEVCHGRKKEQTPKTDDKTKK
jgi:hypothetical protein